MLFDFVRNNIMFDFFNGSYKYIINQSNIHIHVCYIPNHQQIRHVLCFSVPRRRFSAAGS